MPNIIDRIKAFGNPNPPMTLVDFSELTERDIIQVSPSAVPMSAGLRIEGPSSVQPQYQAGSNEEPFFFTAISSLGQTHDGLPPWGSPGRDQALRDLYPTEPILCGAVTSMVQKATSMGWVVRGRRNTAKQVAQLLYGADDGRGWFDIIERTAQDFYSTDTGGIWELGRTSPDGPIAGIYHIDSAKCYFRRNRALPLVYYPDTGKQIYFRREDFVNFTSMPSPNESTFGLGRCAVSRAARAAKLLTTLYGYDDEMLSNLPPKGLALITGMTAAQVRDAITQYKLAREQNSQATFPGVLWLASVQNVDAKLVPFSSLPEHFDRDTVVNLYVYTLALTFGVDAREFWPATTSGATKADALVQAQKARGKGESEFLIGVERAINFRIAPNGVTFELEVSNDEEDRLQAEVNSVRVEALMKMYGSKSASSDRRNPVLQNAPSALVGDATGEVGDAAFGGMRADPIMDPIAPVLSEESDPEDKYEGGGIITRDEARQLLAYWGIVPEDILGLPHDQSWDTMGHGFKADDDNGTWDVAYKCDRGYLQEVVNKHPKRFYMGR